jgi:hypothetical protein
MGEKSAQQPPAARPAAPVAAWRTRSARPTRPAHLPTRIACWAAGVTRVAYLPAGIAGVACLPAGVAGVAPLPAGIARIAHLLAGIPCAAVLSRAGRL